MKLKNILFIGLLLSIFSCSDDPTMTVENETIDFIGLYQGIIDCQDINMEETPEENGVLLTLEISKDLENPSDYLVEFKHEFDPIEFKAIQEGNVMKLYAQTVNEGQGFDEVSMLGEIELVEGNEFKFDFDISTDGEYEITCDFLITKQ